MSGHSHWAGIKHKKGEADAKRSKIFSKLAQEIALAARDGGDPQINSRLRQVLDKAHSFNMPTDNITRAIKRGTGEEGGIQLEEVLFEGYGPGGIAVLVAGITDNKNRALGEVKQALVAHQGKLVEGGAVRWLFEHKGVTSITPNAADPQQSKENLELIAIEAGAEDLSWHENGLDVICKPTELETVKKNLQAKGLTIESSSLDWVPKEYMEIPEREKEEAEKLFEDLDEKDSVQEIYSNLKI